MTLNIILPAGISFYTFQSLSYIIDVYRRIIEPEKSIIRYALFLAFFPQLVAGPIVMAKEFLPQIREVAKQKFSDIPLNKAFYFLLLGFFKKSVLADNISILVEMVFSDSIQIKSLSWMFILIGIIAYSIQIYCDFSGYTDIACGVALCFGFNLPENFNLPYFSNSLSDFWRRWHISLSAWLRSYLYIPLGGNRFSEFMTYRNLFLTMLLGGLWHGASWNFILWGSLHGLYLGIERFCILFFKDSRIFSDVRPPIKNAAKWLYTLFIFVIVTILWVFFRSSNFETAILIFSGIINLQVGIEPGYTFLTQFFLIFIVVFVSHFIGYNYSGFLNRLIENNNSNWQFSVYAMFAIIGVLYSGELKPFIYFVF